MKEFIFFNLEVPKNLFWTIWPLIFFPSQEKPN